MHDANPTMQSTRNGIVLTPFMNKDTSLLNTHQEDVNGNGNVNVGINVPMHADGDLGTDIYVCKIKMCMWKM